jgi:predicted metal-dependent hydrolase
MSGAARSLHPELTPAERAALLARGTERFNGGEFFAAHEAWEEIWRSTTPEPRDLFQGLVQLAAAFHHLIVRNRPDVARRVLIKAHGRLAPFAPRAGGVELTELLETIERWERHLAAPVAQRPPLPQVTLRAG